MKNQKRPTKSLRLTGETVRKLDLDQLADVIGAGTTSNNGTHSFGTGPTFCYACQQ